MMFHVGQKVVCVRNQQVEQWLHRGAIYVVRGIETEIGGVQLEGIGPSVDEQGFNWYFINNRFRPIVDRKTDISVFTALLDSVKAKDKELI